MQNPPVCRFFLGDELTPQAKLNSSMANLRKYCGKSPCGDDQYHEIKENEPWSIHWDGDVEWGDATTHGPILAELFDRPVIYIGINFWNLRNDHAMIVAKHEHGKTTISLPLKKVKPPDYETELVQILRSNQGPRPIYLLHGWTDFETNANTHYNLIDFRPEDREHGSSSDSD
jgi:hypothetical protein